MVIDYMKCNRKNYSRKLLNKEAAQIITATAKLYIHTNNNKQCRGGSSLIVSFYDWLFKMSGFQQQLQRENTEHTKKQKLSNGMTKMQPWYKYV